LRIQAREILDAAQLHRILTGNDVTCAQPSQKIGVVIKMCGVRRHGRTLARVFENNFRVKNPSRTRPHPDPLTPHPPAKNFRKKYLTDSNSGRDFHWLVFGRVHPQMVPNRSKIRETVVQKNK
jgi:hypothetical protein